MNDAIRTDVLVIGSGLGGLAAAWEAAKRGCAVTLLTRASNPEDSNTYRAQGGIIYRADSEAPEQLVADILSAGAGLSSPAAAALLSQEGPRLVKEILIDELHVPFDSSPDHPGELDLTSEAGHSLQRIIHYKDQTGFAIERAFFERVSSHPKVKVISNATAVDLLTASHHSVEPTDVYRPLTCVGAYVLDQTTGKVFSILAKETVLASGGLGSVFLHTTNPPGARGDGIAMAYRAGARCINMQYIQFHPTALLPDFGDGTRRRRPPRGSPRQRIHATVPCCRLARPARRCCPRHLSDDARIGRALRLSRYHAQACRAASRTVPWHLCGLHRTRDRPDARTRPGRARSALQLR